MKIVTSFLSVLYVVCHQNVQADENIPCTTTLVELNGICIPYSDCDFTKDRDIVTKETIYEIQNRIAVCSQHGSNLVCCESSVISTTFIPTRSETTNLTTDDPLLHPNYQVFKNLKCGSSSTNRISQGNDTSLYEFPWAVLLGYQRTLRKEIEWNCGGSIISEFFVLTAAHCLFPHIRSDYSFKLVRLGEFDKNTDPDCDNSDPDEPLCAEPVKDIPVSMSKAHAGFDKKTRFNDIGLVKLSEAASFKTKSVKPICLPFKSNIQEIPPKLIVIGWGKTENGSNGNGILQKANLPFYETSKCLKKFADFYAEKNVKANFVLSESQFCAGGEGNTDSCRGDSGSPIQWPDSSIAKFVQYGIVSYGVSTCGEQEGFPGIYTSIPKYLNWILDNMQ